MTQADPEATQPTAQALGAYVNAGTGHETFLAECITEAAALLTARLGEHAPDVPAPIRRRATMDTAAALWNRRHAPHGVAGFAGDDAAPIRVSHDPLVSAWPILRPYLPLGLA